MARRYFTVDEANALLPRLRAEVVALREGNRELAAARARLARFKALTRLNGHADDALATERRIGDLLRDLGARLDRLRALGVELKDLDNGTLDFPHWREGRVVYLCWHIGEELVAYWHETEAGFRGRQPL